MTHHQRLLAEELIDRARQLRIVNPYVLHGERLLRDFEARQLPIVFIDSDAKLRYLNESEVLRPLVFEIENTITLSALLRGEILEVNIFELFRKVFQRNGFPDGHEGIASLFGQTEDRIRTEGDNLSFEINQLSSSDAAIASELIYSLSCFLTIYERYFNTRPDSVNEAKGIKNAALHGIPIYVFGIPRALVVCPYIAQHELNMMMSTITMGLERLVWDVFITRTSSRIRDKVSVSGAVRENLDVLIPPCDWDRLGFPVREINIRMGEAVLRKGFPIINGELKSDLIIQQQNLCDRIGAYFETWDSVRQAILNETLRSAIAAIMGRNMSHNLGSHAIGYVASEPRLYDLSELGRLLAYIQKRMDFIAQISTSPPSWCLSLPWSDSRTSFPERSKNEETGDWKNQSNANTPYALISNFARQFGLLDNIARSDKFRFRPRAEIDDGAVSGGSNQRALKLRLQVETAPGQAHTPPKILNPDIPHGHIGAHALYSILENLLRNAAKYGTRNSGALDLSVTIRETWHEHQQNKLHGDWQNEFYQVVVSDNQPLSGDVQTEKYRHDCDTLCAQLNDYLESPIVNPVTAELDAGQWGMKEIKICTAYLRLIAQEDIDHKFDLFKPREDAEVRDTYAQGKEPPVIEARLRQVGNEYYLDYLFYLLRPKEALFIGLTLPHSFDAAAFESAGIDFWSWEQLQNHIENKGNLRHQFLVVCDEISVQRGQWLETNMHTLPCRIFVAGHGELPDTLPERVSRCARVLEQDEFLKDEILIEWRLRLWKEWCKPFKGELVVRFEVDYVGEVEGLIRFVTQDMNDRFVDTPRKGAYVYDHLSDAHVSKDYSPESPGTRLYDAACFHEGLDEGPVKSLLREVGDNRLDKLTDENQIGLWRLKEASALSVAILDERIFERAKDVPSGIGTGKYKFQPEKLTFSGAWRKRGVYLLNHHFDGLRAESGEILLLDDNTEGLFSDMPLPGITQLQHGEECVRDKLYDFLVVHQGVLDKLHDQSEKLNHETGSKGDFEQGWERLLDHARVVVIDTGRGKPPESQSRGFRWVDFSNLSEAAFRGGKLQLATLLFALQATRI